MSCQDATTTFMNETGGFVRELMGTYVQIVKFSQEEIKMFKWFPVYI